MTNKTALKLKREAAQRAEEAVNHIIHHPDQSYSMVARKFGVKPGAIRSRIEHRFGTLAEARSVNRVGIAIEKRRAIKRRKCMVCKKPADLDENKFICDCCKSKINRMA
jgi:transposase-like protein